jgi:hypothetical protein
VHLVFAAPLDFFKSFELGPPVLQNQPVMVDLQDTAVTAPAQGAPSPATAGASPSLNHASQTEEQQADEPQATSAAEEPRPGKPDTGAAPLHAPQMTSPPLTEAPAEPALGPVEGQNVVKVSATQRVRVLTEALPAPLRKPDEFLTADREMLSYRISMSGIPVGTAELEAKQEKGEVRITLRVQSNAAFSQLYPVDDSIETRHIAGNFILSRIRQREGSFRGDKGFTIFLRDKSVFWIDRLKKQSIWEALPNNSVVDILSGLYYLRNQPLEVGKSVMLQLFDSNRYAATSVAVLRKEHLTLPGLRQVDTLLVHPQLKTEGIFKRTGDIFVWLTDDLNKVPVKVETRISLGKVTAELVSAETHRNGEAPAGKADANRLDQVSGAAASGMIGFNDSSQRIK